ncbi:MAG: DUF1465 family protein [Rickettsiales bacterium]
MAALYLSRTYDEAFDLLIEARGLAEREYRRRHSKNFEDRMIQIRESMRLTSRLAQIVAWLLAQKAYQAGELSSTDIAAQEYRLAGEKICLDWRAAHETPLPPSLMSLLRRSYELYCRVRRLDQQFVEN